MRGRNLSWGRRLRLWLRLGFRKGARRVDRWLTPLPEPRRSEGQRGVTWQDYERARGVRRGRLRRRLRVEG